MTVTIDYFLYHAFPGWWGGAHPGYLLGRGVHHYKDWWCKQILTQNTSCIRTKAQVISGVEGGRGLHPPCMYLPLRSAPGMEDAMFQALRNKQCLPARKDFLVTSLHVHIWLSYMYFFPLTYLMHTVPTKVIVTKQALREHIKSKRSYM